MPSVLLNLLAVIFSFSTATGILLHDMHLDKAAVAAFSAPSAGATNSYDSGSKWSNLSTDLHPHTERHSLSQFVHDIKTTSPSIQPRSEEKKHLMQKHIARGHHAFDNYNLPLV